MAESQLADDEQGRTFEVTVLDDTDGSTRTIDVTARNESEAHEQASGRESVYDVLKELTVAPDTKTYSSRGY